MTLLHNGIDAYYHCAITGLFEEYYEAKEEIEERGEKGAGIPASLRIKHSNDLLERYFNTYEKHASESVLSRLATYILLDELSDSHPDKMSREEYPIMSVHQIRTRHEKETTLADVYTGKDDATIGRRRGSDGTKNRIYDYMAPKTDVGEVQARYVDLYDALEGAGLTARQRQAIDLVYFEDLTQEKAAEVMGVSRSSLRSSIERALSKVKEFTKSCRHLRRLVTSYN